VTSTLSTPLLTSEQQYHQDVAPYIIPAYTPGKRDSTRDTHIAQLVACARAGDREAQHALLLGLQEYVQYWASRFARAYAWASPRIDYQEMVSIGNLAMTERVEAVLSREHPYSALASLAKYAMWNHCKRYASCITTPDGAEPICSIASLEARFPGDDDRCLLDILPAPQEPSDTPAETRFSVQQVREAITHLSPRQRQVIERLYGLEGHSAQRLTDLLGELEEEKTLSFSTLESYRRRALTILQRLLTEPQLEETYTVEQACQRLQVSRRNLKKLVSQHHVKSVGKRGQYPKSAIDRIAQERQRAVLPRSQEAIQQALAQGLTQLEQQRLPVTQRQLARMAHVSQSTAWHYLKEHQTRQAV
jgi:DNA-directed RNA polymerase specialized sigma24 family protein